MAGFCTRVLDGGVVYSINRSMAGYGLMTYGMSASESRSVLE